jgi:hypothetical protein
MERVELELLRNEPPYTFVSLGIRDRLNDTYLPSKDFPIGTKYRLLEGEFPPQQDQYDYDHLFYGPNGEIEAKVKYFAYACRTGLGAPVQSGVPCRITIQRANTPQTGEKQMGGKQMRGKHMGGKQMRGKQTRGRKTKRQRRNRSKRRRKS